MTIWVLDWARFYIRDVNGHKLYKLPKTKADWCLWEADVSERVSEKEEILFQDADGYWLLDWKEYLRIHPLVAFFTDKTMNEKELLDNYGIIIKRSVGTEPDKGPWFSISPNAGKL